MALFKESWLVRALLDNSIHLIYPARCLICQVLAENTQDICSSCYQRLPWNHNSCRQCALPLSYGKGINNNTMDVLCGRCQKKQPYFDMSYSAFCYEGDVIRLIHQLKFQQNLVYSRLLSAMLANHITGVMRLSAVPPECLLPVPLHRKRLRQRGFNQSIELAKDLSKRLSVPLETDKLIRCRETVSQSGLDAKQRRQNIKGAFELKDKINVKHVAIIDDVVTTGSTVNEIARLLKASGVERVDVYSIARA